MIIIFKLSVFNSQFFLLAIGNKNIQVIIDNRKFNIFYEQNKLYVIINTLYYFK